MVKPLAMALMKFTPRDADNGSSPNRIIKNRPSRMNIGAPGGCGICSLYALEMNSPVSQKLSEASIVNTYTEQAIRQTIQPAMLLTLLKFIDVILYSGVENCC